MVKTKCAIVVNYPATIPRKSKGFGGGGWTQLLLFIGSQFVSAESEAQISCNAKRRSYLTQTKMGSAFPFPRACSKIYNKVVMTLRRKSLQDKITKSQIMIVFV